jgi:predicted nucleotide-binding protein
LSAVFGYGTAEYNRYSPATQLDQGPVTMGAIPGLTEVLRAGKLREYLSEGKDQALSLLRQAVRTLQEEIDLEIQAPPIAPTARPASPCKVFVVHGHDIHAREAMARFLDKIGLEPIILQEQPDKGFTIIEKFEANASQVSFAVVLLTPDDIGALASASMQSARARQNVIFELGYFVGKLGRGRACLLRKGAVEIPSDLYGVIYTDMDDGEGWKLKLIKEFKAAKLEFDASRVWE